LLFAFSWPTLSHCCTLAMTSGAAASESAHRACVDLAAEWQGFIGRRLDEDLHLFQELSAAKAPEEVWNAWSRFWEKATWDYAVEYAAIAKFAAGFIPHGIGADTASWSPTRTTQAKAA